MYYKKTMTMAAHGHNLLTTSVKFWVFWADTLLKKLLNW